MSANLEQIAHRPWPLPDGRWIMAQSWHDLLFAHWPLPEAMLRPHVPASFAIDTPLLHFAKQQDVVVWQPQRLAL